MVPEEPVVIEHTCAVQISSNINNTLPRSQNLEQLLVRQTLLALRQKCKSFNLNKVAHLQHFFLT